MFHFVGYCWFVILRTSADFKYISMFIFDLKLSYGVNPPFGLRSLLKL
jgi:hypothetical protein